MALATVLTLALCAVWPIQRVGAAEIEWFHIKDVAYDGYLIGGKTYHFSFQTDRALGSLFGTNVVPYFQYSDGKQWHKITSGNYSGAISDKDIPLYFIVPITPELTSATFMLTAYFAPKAGSASESTKVLGPYKVLQPAGPDDLSVKANNDGTVTLEWNDNSNIETSYRITRAGPDGTKTFTVSGKESYMGPLSYTDKTTNMKKDTVYLYTLATVINAKYGLTEDDMPGVINRLVKTKVPEVIRDRLDIIVDLPDLITVPTPDPPIQVKPQLSDLVTSSIVSQDVLLAHYQALIDKLNKNGNAVPGVGNNLVPVSGIVLGTKEVALQPGGKVALIPMVTPADASNKNIVWSSSNPSVVTVDAAGQVTAVSPGTAKITARTEEGGFTVISVVTVAEPNLEPPTYTDVLTDIGSHPAKQAILTAVDLGFVTGYPDGTFKPENNITRAEFSTMLMKALNAKEQGTDLTFKDNNTIGAWAVPAIQQAVKLGIISGYQDGTFRPNANITHAEMIAMVMRASGLPLDNMAQTTFPDNQQIPSWARPAAAAAQNSGITLGFKNGLFAPQVLSTRAEAATVIVNMLAIKSK